ncbi:MULTISPECIES: regulatory protein RecX [unclassified Microbacterium]|uniref:regulatory protein RecX n=1 Tax=unclassified Microbacterium TaxID=2609290 RepID=UPI000EA8CBED|nr:MULTISPECIES: regulatory protein RecX [unclassified Microbacterium]MBT2485612.1 regulatory protein RecX [Microbacterium sp. ISL-108]RKN68392.1 RecX family transcriptional regulator [Microbacterium sp. CGR2]
MNDANGGGSERIAPIIPLFGSRTTASPGAHAAKPSVSDDAINPEGDGAAADAGTPSERHPARGAAARMAASQQPEPERSAPRLRALSDPHETSAGSDDVRSPEQVRATAEESLLRKLRSKSLSIAEARLVLRGHDLDAAQIDDVIDDFLRRRYLDDAILASALVTSGVERKGQGRVALSRSLSQRGIPRDVIDAALDELPDDDAERALDFARTKARSMGRLDNDTALRRLVGQLARRGYNGGVAMNAAKTALREIGSGGSPSGVRFVDSD